MSGIELVSPGDNGRPSPGASGDERVNILLVDDRQENLLALEGILEPLNENLIRANSGPEALRQLLLHQFAVILLDVQMPGMNGLETAQYIKAREKSRSIPILFLTAISKEDNYIFKGYEVGAVDYLFKPFNPDILRSKVAVFVDLWRKQLQIQRQEETIRDVERRELELQHRAELLESEARSAAELSVINEKLQQRQAELELAMTSRSRFYASMSHELRTPINAVIGYSTLMLDNIYGPLNEKQREGIRRTHKAAKHLLELVNDVLDLSKIEAGKLDMAYQPVQFPGLIEDLFITVGPLAAEHKTDLQLESGGPQVSVTTDPRRIRQILLNLLSNAIKFGRGNPVRVRCDGTPEGGIAIEVIDQGEGIAPENMERIFDEFSQFSTTKHPGTGLGLAISRRLAQLLDGALQVESQVDRGSLFRLVLPKNVGNREARIGNRESEAGSQESGIGSRESGVGSRESGVEKPDS
ncbi:MAG: ATP-binding protein [Gemmatimonadaceae bacterium]